MEVPTHTEDTPQYRAGSSSIPSLSALSPVNHGCWEIIWR